MWLASGFTLNSRPGVFGEKHRSGERRTPMTPPTVTVIIAITDGNVNISQVNFFGK
jgi:hypothetical protein